MTAPVQSHVSQAKDDFIVTALCFAPLGALTVLFFGFATDWPKPLVIMFTAYFVVMLPVAVIFYRHEMAQAQERDQHEAIWRCALNQQQIPDTQRS